MSKTIVPTRVQLSAACATLKRGISATRKTLIETLGSAPGKVAAKRLDGAIEFIEWFDNKSNQEAYARARTPLSAPSSKNSKAAPRMKTRGAGAGV